MMSNVNCENKKIIKINEEVENRKHYFLVK